MMDEAIQHELGELIAAMRERGLDAQQGERLAALLRGSAEARAMYLRGVDLCASIRRCSADLSFTRDPGEHEAASMLTESLMRQRLKLSDDLSHVAEAIVTHHEPPEAEAEPVREAVIVGEPLWKVRRRAWIAAVIGLAACVAGIGAVNWLLRPLVNPGHRSWFGRPGGVAHIIEARDAVWEGGGFVAPGAHLEPGTYRLARGRIEMTMASGVAVVLHGPAELTLDDPMRASLTHGRIEATVPHEASGFAVDGPGFRVIDIGTEFTVDVPRRGRAWVHVTKGAVDLALTNRDGSVRRTMRLTDDLSALVDPASRRVVLSEPMPIELFNTGAKLTTGEPDPYWQITAVSDEPDFKPQPAYAVTLDPRWIERGAGNAARWVSRYPDNRPVSGSSVHTFATAFDLTGMDPSTAKLVLRFIADNRVDAIRLNGLSIDVPAHREQPPFATFSEVAMDHGFVPGLNTLELDVRNIWPRNDLSPMGLLAELSGTAHRLVEWNGSDPQTTEVER